MDITCLEMQAVRKETNNYRFYFLTISKDMFNYFVVTAIYGRIGTKGTKKMFSYQTVIEAQQKIKEIILRRKTLKNRIGIEYQVTQQLDPYGLLNVVHQQCKPNR